MPIPENRNSRSGPVAEWKEAVKPKQHTLLKRPAGTEGLQPEDAVRHRDILHILERLFDLWGYLPIRTPIVDFADVYASLLGRDDWERAYRLIDREGDVLLLRPDVTLFLAKQIATLTPDLPSPARLYYADTIMRHEAPESISRNEYFQIGSELIGSADADADLETLVLLFRVLDAVLPGAAMLHVGTRALPDAWTQAFSASNAAELGSAIRLRDLDTVRNMLAQTEMGRRGAEARARLAGFIGTPREFAELHRTLAEELDPCENRAVSHAHDAVETVNRVTEGERAVVDFSEVGSRAYYTGITFRAYVEGAEAEVAAGGRYDKLYGKFGLDRPAVGFSVMLRRLEALASRETTQQRAPGTVSGPSFVERVTRAEERRSHGERVVL